MSCDSHNHCRSHVLAAKASCGTYSATFTANLQATTATSLKELLFIYEVLQAYSNKKQDVLDLILPSFPILYATMTLDYLRPDVDIILGQYASTNK